MQNKCNELLFIFQIFKFCFAFIIIISMFVQQIKMIMHDFEKMPDNEIEGLGSFEVFKCKICGVKKCTAYFDGAIPSYFGSNTLTTTDPGCHDLNGFIDSNFPNPNQP